MPFFGFAAKAFGKQALGKHDLENSHLEALENAAPGSLPPLASRGLGKLL